MQRVCMQVLRSSAQSVAARGLHGSAASMALEIGKVQKGTVKWYNLKRGYGFIIPDEAVDQEGMYFSV